MSEDFEEIALPDPPAAPATFDETLGQADIDALFGDVGAPAEAKSGLRAVIDSDLINQDRLPMLEVVCDRVVRTFATNMRNLTSDAIDVSLIETTSIRFGEFMNRVALPAMFGVFRVEEWENYGVVVVESGLSYAVIDALLGGRRGNGAVKIEGRAYTTIETTLVSRMIELALADFSAAFEPIAPIGCRLERIETSPRFASIAGPSNITAVATFRVDMEERGGRFSILLPYATLEPVREKLLQRFMGEKMGRDATWENHMDAEIRRSRVRVEAILAEKTMNLDEVRGFSIGQVIPFGRHPDDPLDLRCSGVRLGRAQLGRRNSNVAVRLTTPIARS